MISIFKIFVQFFSKLASNFFAIVSQKSKRFSSSRSCFSDVTNEVVLPPQRRLHLVDDVTGVFPVVVRRHEDGLVVGRQRHRRRRRRRRRQQRPSFIGGFDDQVMLDDVTSAKMLSTCVTLLNLSELQNTSSSQPRGIRE